MVGPKVPFFQSVKERIEFWGFVSGLISVRIRIDRKFAAERLNTVRKFATSLLCDVGSVRLHLCAVLPRRDFLEAESGNRSCLTFGDGCRI